MVHNPSKVQTSGSETLTGWKEISAYLSVTVRTAQMWEKERGLPVRRYPGKRSAVYVETNDLERWRSRTSSECRRHDPVPIAPRIRKWPLAALALTAMASSGAAWMAFHHETSLHGPQLSPRPLTAGTGFEGRPALSPDGRLVAYLARSAAESSEVRLRGADGAGDRVLARDALFESTVKWSPDGNQIAYARPCPNGIEYVGVEISTGRSGVIRSAEGADRQISWIDSSFFDWGEVGFAFSARERAGGPYHIAIAPPDGGASRQVSRPPDRFAGDTAPAFSPGGRHVAFVRFSSLSEAEIHVVEIETGEERQVTHENARIWGVAWMPDGRSLVYSSSNSLGHPRLLWRSLLDGEPRPLTSPEFQIQYPSISAAGAGSLLAYQRKERFENIWHWTPSDAPKPIVESTSFDAWPELAPDGETLAFVSKRSGAHEIWMTRPGEEPRRLTFQDGPYSDMPRWSPDGTSIAFSSAESDGNRDIYVVDVESKHVRRFTTEPSEEGRASWSRDGRWIYFRSDRSGEKQIWKRRSDGSGAAVQVTSGGGYEGFESPDGRTLYYIPSRENAELWAVPVGGGQEQRILEGPQEAHWRVADRGIVYSIDSSFALWDASTGRTETLLDRPNAQPPSYGFAVTPSVDRLLWSQTDRDTSNIWLGELSLGRSLLSTLRPATR